MAGVIAHRRAIVSSANARVLVTFMIVLLPLTTRNNDTTSNYNLSSPLTMAAVTEITHRRDQAPLAGSSDSANVASGTASAMSHAATSPTPPPYAAPVTRAIVGFDNA